MHALPLCLITLSTLLSAAGPEEPNKRPGHVEVLLVTGVDYAGHLWKETGPAMRNVLEKDKRLEVRLVEDPEFLSSPAIADYDVIIVHFKNYFPFVRDRQVRENLAKFVKQGKGLVLIHLACGAFENWPEFANLAGKTYDHSKAHDPAPAVYREDRSAATPRRARNARFQGRRRALFLYGGRSAGGRVGHGTLDSHR